MKGEMERKGWGGGKKGETLHTTAAGSSCSSTKHHITPGAPDKKLQRKFILPRRGARERR